VAAAQSGAATSMIDAQAKVDEAHRLRLRTALMVVILMQWLILDKKVW